MPARKALKAVDPATVIDEDGVEQDAIGPGSDDEFVFESSAGIIRICSLSKGKNPNPYAVAKARAQKEADRLLVLFVKAKAGKDSDAVEEILEQLDEDEFQEFFKGWQKHSGIDVGE